MKSWTLTLALSCAWASLTIWICQAVGSCQ
jgi:hypothetical protein